MNSLEDFLDQFCDDAELIRPTVEDFEDMLAEYGYMVVPIEDPTNLRFGVDD